MINHSINHKYFEIFPSMDVYKDFDFYHPIAKKVKEDKYSIIILTKDSTMITRCVESILAKSVGKKIEILIGYTAFIPQKPKGKNIFWFDCRPWHYSRNNNFLVEQSKGNILIFLNDDLVITRNDWIELLLDCLEKYPGLVGGKLVFPSGKVQHNGMYLSDKIHPGTIYPGIVDRDRVVKDDSSVKKVLGVAGAMMMIRKDVYTMVGGLNEKYNLTHQDVDFCLKIAMLGMNVTCPNITLATHEESVTFNKEADVIERIFFTANDLKLLRERFRIVKCS